MIVTGCGNSNSLVENEGKTNESTKNSEITADSETTTPTKKVEETESSSEKETATEKKTEQMTSEVVTEPVTQAPTEPATQAPTQPVTQAPTQPQTQAPTQPPTQAPTQAPTKAQTEKQTTEKNYDITSKKYQDEVVQKTLEYINEFRKKEGHVALTYSKTASAYAKERSKYLKTNFEHDCDDERAAATSLKYGKYIDPVLYGLEGEPYWEPYGQEAIANVGGNEGTSPDELAYSIAYGCYKSKGHWAYVGGTNESYRDCIYFAMGMTYDYGDWYICIDVLEEKLD